MSATHKGNIRFRESWRPALDDVEFSLTNGGVLVWLDNERWRWFPGDVIDVVMRYG